MCAFSLECWFFGGWVFWIPCRFWILVPYWMSSCQRFSSILWAVSWVCWLFPLLCSSLIGCSPICSLFLLDAEPFEVCLCMSHSLYPNCPSVLPTASWSHFNVSGLILSSLMHFELILVQGERQGSSFSLLPVFPAAFVKRDCLFFIVCFGSFVEDHLTIDAWIYVWIFYSDPLIFLSLLVPLPCCFYCYGTVL
jgi:hypothetical protein